MCRFIRTSLDWHMMIGVQPEVVYAGVVGERNLKQATLPEPDMNQARWLQIENNSKYLLVNLMRC